MKGVRHPSLTMPLWVGSLEMAEAWGIPPWVVEEQASQAWVERYLLYRNEIAKEQERQAEKAKRNVRR